MAPPGTTSVEVEVYDVGKKVDGIQVVADIMTFQASQGQLQVQRTFAVNNVSKPPRTQMNEHNLEFYVPDGATVSEGQAMTAGGQPVNSAPVPEGANAKNRYAFLFPLRPGETRFSVVYSVPYTGSVNIDPKSIYPLEHFVVIAPKVMEFSAAPGAHFEVAPYPGQPDANVEVSSNTHRANPSHSSSPVKAPWLPLSKKAAEVSRAKARPSPARKPPRRRTRTAHRRSRPPAEISLVDSRRIRRRPDSRRSLSSPSRQQAANRAARAKGKVLPEFEDDEEYEPEEVPVGRELRAANRA